MVKVISLWQPWATLMALGAKRIETRHWYTGYRGWLAIHATRGGLSMEELQNQCFEDSFYQALRNFPPFAEAVTASARRKGWIKDVFPHGSIVAVARLIDCKMFVDTTEALGGRYDIRMLPPDEPEVCFGNYDAGRYGLITSEVFALPEPIPFTSRQGKLLELPDEILAELRRQWRSKVSATGSGVDQMEVIPK